MKTAMKSASITGIGCVAFLLMLVVMIAINLGIDALLAFALHWAVPALAFRTAFGALVALGFLISLLAFLFK